MKKLSYSGGKANVSFNSCNRCSPHVCLGSSCRKMLQRFCMRRIVNEIRAPSAQPTEQKLLHASEQAEDMARGRCKCCSSCVQAPPSRQRPVRRFFNIRNKSLQSCSTQFQAHLSCQPPAALHIVAAVIATPVATVTVETATVRIWRHAWTMHLRPASKVASPWKLQIANVERHLGDTPKTLWTQLHSSVRPEARSKPCKR